MTQFLRTLTPFILFIVLLGTAGCSLNVSITDLGSKLLNQDPSVTSALIYFENESLIITEGAAPTSVAVKMSYAQSTDLVVNLTLLGSAGRFFAVPLAVTIPAGQTSVFFDLVTINDSIYQGTEDFTLTLSSLDFRVQTAQSSMAIRLLDDEAPPEISFSSVTQLESISQMVVIATLNRESTRPVTFKWSTSDGTANAPGDFTSAAVTTATIAAGATYTQLSVPVINDVVVESLEQFRLNFSDPTLSSLAEPFHDVSILDDDGTWTPMVFINGLNETAVYSSPVDLKLFAPTIYTEMYITNTPGCTAGGIWEAYSSQKTGWSLNPAQQGATAAVYVKFRDAGLAESSCISKTVEWRNPTVYRMCSATSSTDSFGILEDSGGAAGDYSEDEDCDFSIQTQGALRMQFLALALEEDYDFLTVWDGDILTPEILEATGASLPNLINLNSGHAKLNFFSDGSVVDQGFRMLWDSSSSAYFTINNGASYSNSASVSLQIRFLSFPEMYITNMAGCSAGGAWTSSAATTTWTLSAGDGLKTVYIKFRDLAGHESDCSSSSIGLIATSPVALITAPGNGDDSPALDIKPSGIYLKEYRYKFGLSSEVDCSVESGYSAETPVSQAINDSLATYVEGETLKICVVGKNAFGVWQTYAAATTATWTRKIFPTYIEFAQSGLYLTEADQSVNLMVTSTRALNQDLSFKYEVFGDLVSLQSLAGGTGIILAGQTSANIRINLSNNPATDTDRSLYVVITSVGSAQHRVGFQQASTIVVKDAQRASSNQILDLAGSGNCAIFAPGTLHCTTNNSNFTQVGVKSNYTKIINSSTHTCVLDADKYLWCFGAGTKGQLGVGGGANLATPTQIPTLKWDKVVVSKDNYCGIDDQDDLYCWGDGASNLAGPNSPANVLTPTLVDSAYKFVDVDMAATACAVTSAGALRCWGKDNYYLFGNGSFNNTDTPATTPDSDLYVQVRVGAKNACGITTNGDIKCWGQEWRSGSGDVTTPLLVDSSDDYAALHIGKEGGTVHCAINATQNLKCWGYDPGNVVLPSTVVLTPVVMKAGQTYSSAHLIGKFYDLAICGLTTAGVVECAGSALLDTKAGSYDHFPTTLQRWDQQHTYSTLITDTSLVHEFNNTGAGRICGITTSGLAKCLKGPPTSVGPLGDLDLTFKLYSSSVSWNSLSRTCGTDTSDKLYCWGWSRLEFSRPDRGVAQVDNALILQSEMSLKKFVHIYGDFICALNSADRLVCGGYGPNGSGDSSFSSYDFYVVDATNTYRDVAMAFASSSYSVNVCAVTSDFKLMCWGRNENGEVGDGTLDPVFTMKHIDPGVEYISVVAGITHFCGLTKDQYVKCWGKNPAGIGSGATQSTSPVSVDGLNKYTKIVAVPGAYALEGMCGLRDNGQIFCWGDGDRGKLGTGNTTDRSAPTSIIDGGLTYTDLISSQLDAVCAISAGKTYCWGSPYTSTPALAFNGVLKNISADFQISPKNINSVTAIDSVGNMYRTSSLYYLPGSFYNSKYFEVLQGIVDR